MTKGQERTSVFVFGVVFVAVMLGISLWTPNPTPSQYQTFKVVLALAAAGVAAFIPGFLQVTVSNLVRAGGALAVFALVYLQTPAQMVAEPRLQAETPWHAQGRVIDQRGTPIAGAVIRIAVSSVTKATTTSRSDGTFEADVEASPDLSATFSVTPPGRPPFLHTTKTGLGYVELAEGSQP